MESSFRSPLIRQDVSGTYCVGFANKCGFDIEEICTIFSEFGKVVSIKETGDKKGYRFVRYDYADEAEKAVDGLKTNPNIQLVEHKPSNRRSENKKENKFQNNNGNRNKNSNGNRNENDSENSNGNANKYQNSSRNGKANSYQNGNKYYHFNIYNKDDPNCSGNFGEENQNNNGNDKEKDKINNNIFKERNQVHKRTFNGNPIQNDQMFNNGSSRGNSSNENLSCNAKPCNSINLLSDNHVIKANVNSLTSSLSYESLYVEDEYDLPELVQSKKCTIKNSSPKKTILNAEEIIVGNIPNDLGSAFILHLFDRYHPIAISNINFVKNTSIRYCHVYFKTVENCLEVEKVFDHMKLSGQNLLVLRPCQLIQEAVC